MASSDGIVQSGIFEDLQKKIDQDTQIKDVSTFIPSPSSCKALSNRTYPRLSVTSCKRSRSKVPCHHDRNRHFEAADRMTTSRPHHPIHPLPCALHALRSTYATPSPHAADFSPRTFDISDFVFSQCQPSSPQRRRVLQRKSRPSRRSRRPRASTPITASTTPGQERCKMRYASPSLCPLAASGRRTLMMKRWDVVLFDPALRVPRRLREGWWW